MPWPCGGSPPWGGARTSSRARSVSPSGNGVEGVTHWTADDAVRFGRVDRKRLRVVPEAADDVFKPSDGAPNRVEERFGVKSGYLLFVGALDARKDPKSLLRAWSTARDARPVLPLSTALSPAH